ncbi:MAG: Energy-coupling factor transporter ATP-binding protein EcfA3 [Actinobacteria bacterium]|uniref:energy-coupling factor ABC transporter ATP-binding protein n=1 Tax=Candidatus Hakubella thermalkaliphila TaxID=2754717 RepID=UPI002A4E1A87|nr:ATP-binding cassette domain-containing protein [Candidatus Hakubella thermalkaliphila]MBT9170205.1 Energy-coupling factor transporter ATP-binding protein EcfA3 [Actinomycetota bacterium]
MFFLPEVILEARDIEFEYPDGTKALRGVSMGIPKGKKTAVLGPNGAGKTTIFLHFNGILKPTKGKIRFAGRDICYSHAFLLELRKNVGIVFQDPDTQLFSASVLQEISFGPLNLGLSRENVLRRVNQAMAATEIVELKDRPTHFLSYGQKKLVSIADILAMQPTVLICDEPTAWLDPGNAARIMDLFDRINQEGVTIIFSTHDVDLAYSWADYIFVMNQGLVAGEGIPEEVFQNESLLKEADLNKPWLIDVYDELKRKRWVVADMPPPKTRQELMSRISNSP